MGAFFGSSHFRTADRDAVQRILEDHAKKKDARFLLGPLLNGWVTVYPFQHGQDEALAKALAKRLSCDSVHVMVHDDDIFCYWFFRGGKLVDQFNSRPDYFEEVSARTREKNRGRPELFDDLLDSDEARQEMREVLTQEQDELPIFAGETLQSFAELLHLPNAATSYEYLMQGETDGIEGWDQFIHVPDRGPEIAQEKQAESDQADAKQRLKDEGLLLAEVTAGGMVMPIWCPDPTNGFLVTLASLVQPGTYPLERWAPPWTRPAPTGLSATMNDRTARVSPSGRLLALGGFNRTQLWKLDGNTLLHEIP